MYSEAILPEIDDKYLINIIEKYEEKLSEKDKLEIQLEQNHLEINLFYFLIIYKKNIFIIYNE